MMPLAGSELKSTMISCCRPVEEEVMDKDMILQQKEAEVSEPRRRWDCSLHILQCKPNTLFVIFHFILHDWYHLAGLMPGQSVPRGHVNPLQAF